MSDAATQSPCPTVRARTILQKVRYNGDEWFGIDYNMNLYHAAAPPAPAEASATASTTSTG